MNKSIAIVEDEPVIRDNYCRALRQYGYDVKGFSNRPDAEAAFAKSMPDLVIIDVGLGQDIEGGFELCRTLRAKSSTLAIIFLTARDTELDQISGLRLGADDYLTKDINLPHLLARIVALFRRLDAIKTANQTEDEIIHRGALTINKDRMSVKWNQTTVDLTVTEFWMLYALANHPGHVKTRNQLMDAASTVLDDNTITSHIKRIRKKFQQIDPEFSGIQTAYGMGYRWQSESV
jgi:two-component system OmpR family response regulator